MQKKGNGMAIGLLQRKPKQVQVNKVVLLPVAEIISNRSQPRKHFDPGDLQELSNSILQNGLLQPVTVRCLADGKYELIAGERRTMAFRSLGKDYIPGIIEAYSDEQSAVLALIENLQRKDLNYFEEAVGIERLMKELQLTQLEVSHRLGKSQSTVANKLRLLRFPEPLREIMLQNSLTERHARALLKIRDESLLCEVIDIIVQRGLTVEQTEQYIESLLDDDTEKSIKRQKFIVKDMRIFLNSINKAVDMMQVAGIPVNTHKDETGDYVEIKITIPKSSIYRNSQP